MDSKKEARALPALIRIGKSGVTDGLISEIIKQLKKRKMIKIKILNNSPQLLDEIIPRILTATGADLVVKMGNTFVLKKG